MHHKRTYTYKVVEDHEILADVYCCSGEDSHPAILWIHGGALISGARTQISEIQLKYYLSAGYTVISIDYRLAPETKLQYILEDVEDAYVWLRTQGPNLLKVDPDRIALIGVSAGGYLALTAGFRMKPRPKALVSFYGYGNITGSWYTQPDKFYNQRSTISKQNAYVAIGSSVLSNVAPGPLQQLRILFYLYCRQQGLWPREVGGYSPEQEAAWFYNYEPLINVTADYPPTMLLHGKKDTDVPFEQSELMSNALKQHQVICELISNSEWGHNFDENVKVDNSVEQALERVVSFLDTCLST